MTTSLHSTKKLLLYHVLDIDVGCRQTPFSMSLLCPAIWCNIRRTARRLVINESEVEFLSWPVFSCSSSRYWWYVAMVHMRGYIESVPYYVRYCMYTPACMSGYQILSVKMSSKCKGSPLPSSIQSFYRLHGQFAERIENNWLYKSSITSQLIQTNFK